MRTIERTGQFKRDYKREKKGQHRQSLEEDLFPIIQKLTNDEILQLVRLGSHSELGW